MTLESQDKPSAPLSSRYRSNWKRNVLGILISAVCLGLIVWRIDIDEVVRAIANFEWQWLLLGFTSLTLGYVMRIVRWTSLLRAADVNVTPYVCAAPFLGSIALNNVLPMRLGDIVRALVFPAALGVGRSVATSSLIMERLVDLMTLLACLVIGLAMTSTAQLPDWLIRLSIGLAITGGISLVLVFFFSGAISRWIGGKAHSATTAKRQRTLNVLKELLGGFDAMSRLPVLLGLLVLSMLVWSGEAGLFWSLLKGFGLDASVGTAVVVMSVVTLSTLVPSSPGYVGPFHLAAFSAIVMLGGTSAQAASFAVLAHLGVWLPTTVAGAIAILLNPHLFGRIKMLAGEAP